MDQQTYRSHLVQRHVSGITSETPLGYDVPGLCSGGIGIIVISKPPGWEVDVYDVEKFGVSITPVARFYLLSSFLSSLFPRENYPICHLPEYGFGLAHRLDQMSSGLILGATTFQAHFHLQLQMSTYLVQR